MITGKEIIDLGFKSGKWFKEAIAYANQNNLSGESLKNYLDSVCPKFILPHEKSGKMAEAAGIYSYIWRPKELGIVAAKELIEPLKEGLKKLKDHPQIYKRFSAKNGWGTYDQFVPFVAEYLNACMQNPDAEIVVSR